MVSFVPAACYFTGSWITVDPMPLCISPLPSIVKPSGTLVTFTLRSSGLSVNTLHIPSSPVVYDFVPDSEVTENYVPAATFDLEYAANV